MRYVEFGSQKAKASELVLGLMRIREMTPAQVAELVQTGMGCGVNVLDTAPIYGGWHGCECTLGAALASVPGLREQVILQTKVGIRPHPTRKGNYFDFSREHILQSVDESLAALQTDHVDSLLLHRPDVLMVPEEVAGVFQTLHDAGKVLSFGVSNQNVATMARLQRYLPFPITCNQVQLSCAFSPAFNSTFNVNMEGPAAADRDGGVFEYAYSNGQVVQAWSVMQHGYFGGTFIDDLEYAELNSTLQRIADEHGVTKTAVAVNWVLRYPGKMQAIVGTTKPERVRESAAATTWEMSREDWYDVYLAAGNILP